MEHYISRDEPINYWLFLIRILQNYDNIFILLYICIFVILTHIQKFQNKQQYMKEIRQRIQINQQCHKLEEQKRNLEQKLKIVQEKKIQLQKRIKTMVEFGFLVAIIILILIIFHKCLSSPESKYLSTKNMQPNIQLLYEQLTKSMNKVKKNSSEVNALKENYINQIKNEIQKFKNWGNQYKVREISFHNINYIIELSISHSKFDKYLETVNETIIQIHNKLEQYFTKRQAQFKTALENFSFGDLNDILGELKSYQLFLYNLQLYLQKCLIEDPNCHKWNKLFNEFNYRSTVINITNKLKEVKSQITQFKIPNKKVKDQRIAQYQKLNTQLSIMSNVQILSQFIELSHTYKNQTFSSISKQFDQIIQNCTQILQKQPISKHELTQFNIYYSNLIDFNSKVHINEFAYYKDKSKQIQETVKQKIKNYSKIYESSSNQTQVLAQTLIQTKQMLIQTMLFRDIIGSLITNLIENTYKIYNKIDLSKQYSIFAYQGQLNEIFKNHNKIRTIISTLGHQIQIGEQLQKKMETLDKQIINNIQKSIRLKLKQLNSNIIPQIFFLIQFYRNCINRIVQTNNIISIMESLKEIDKNLNSSIQEMIALYSNLNQKKYKQLIQHLFVLKLAERYAQKQNKDKYSKLINQIKKILTQWMQKVQMGKFKQLIEARTKNQNQKQKQKQLIQFYKNIYFQILISMKQSQLIVDKSPNEIKNSYQQNIENMISQLRKFQRLF